jgi:hypothetical protein
MVVGVLEVELHVPEAQSLKDRRSVLKSLKDQLRGRFNVAVAEIDPGEKWQRATVGVSTLADDRAHVQGVLRQVTEWLRDTRLVNLIRVEEDYF